MNDRKTTIMGIAACPHCHAALAWNLNDAFCETCGRRFPVACGVPRFVEWNIEKTADSDFQDDVMSNRSCAAKLYNWGRKFLSSEYMARDHVSEFLGGAAQGSIIVELGAGSRRLREDVTTNTPTSMWVLIYWYSNYTPYLCVASNRGRYTVLFTWVYPSLAFILP